MAYEHGLYVEENPTSLITPLVADSAVQVVIGTAPIHLADENNVNKPILVNNFKEAKEKLGYSDDFSKYTLCEVMDCSFRVFNVSPVVFINVLNPAIHKEEKTAEKSLVAGSAVIEDAGVLLSTIVIKSGVTEHKKDIDYTISREEENVIIERVKDGAITSDTAELTLEYSVLKTDKVSESDILAGIELIGQIYPRLGIIPAITLIPSWTEKVNIGLALLAKSKKINGSFNAMAILDADCETVTEYTSVGEWKNNNYVDEGGIVVWPQAKIGEKRYHLSTLTAARIAQTDAENGNIPYVSPSNKTLKISCTVLKSGEEVYLDQVQANVLNAAGVVTAINMSGWRLWGNNTSIYPTSTDVKDRFIPIKRMFYWQGNTFINTYFQKCDDTMNTVLIESIVDSENIRLNALKARSWIAGAKIQYLQELNPQTDLIGGKITFIQSFTPFPPAESIKNILEFDPKTLENALIGG